MYEDAFGSSSGGSPYFSTLRPLLIQSLRGGDLPIPPVAATAAVIESLRSDDTSKYIQAAVGYFNNLRTPAAVLASIIMKEMFALQSTPPRSMRAWDGKHGIKNCSRWRTLRYTYLMLMILAFALEINTIFVATHMLTQLATTQVIKVDEKVDGIFGRHKVTTSLVDFLLKNFEYEYATVRGHFVTGLISFTVATALRVRYALRKYNALSMSGMCCLLTAASGMLTYANSNTITYGGYVNLLKRQFELSFQFLTGQATRGPLSITTAVLALLTVFYYFVGWLSPEFSYFGVGDVDEEDNEEEEEDDDEQVRKPLKGRVGKWSYKIDYNK